MLLFNKRKIIYILSCIIVSVIIFNFSNENLSEAISTPATNHVVVLDAGHGIPDRWGRSFGWNI